MDLTGEQTFQQETNPQITPFLLDFVNEKLLQNERTQIESTWSGIMGMPPQKGKLPIIREEQPGFWSCYRLGGMGVALSSMVARKLALQI